jgi:signal transduction histidine kinase
MRKLFPIFRKMSFILFASFLIYSIGIVLLISFVNNTNWISLFTRFQATQIAKNSYLVMDDMREYGIVRGPLTNEQRLWLQRRSALYGILLRFESADRKEVWFDTYIKVDLPVSGKSIESPYTAHGDVQGYLRMEYIESSKELEPAYKEFMESISFRSKLLLSGVVALSILLSYFIAGGLTRGLSDVFRMADEIGKGNRDVSPPLKGLEEVRRLAATLHGMTKELKKQEDWRHALMEDLTHELRTPLTTLQTQIEVIVDGVYEPEPSRLQDIYDELIRLSRLVNDLERLSEAESARFSLNIRRTNMVDLARTVHSHFMSLAKSKLIKLTFEPAYVPCYAEVDKDKIVQVLSNLIANAIKYTPEHGKVAISVAWSVDSTLFVVEDNGIGIGEQDLPYIFNRLYRADKSRSRFSGGVGLGLSIAKALTEAHNGTIEAESRLGAGSRFTVILPNKSAAYRGERM